MARITWTTTARLDLRRIIEAIGRESSIRIAEKWAVKLYTAVKTLETLPEIGSPVEDLPFAGLREHIVGPYRVIYRYDGVGCLILTIPRAEQDLRRVITPEDLQ
ncbi:MAG: plasmid stabilization system protein [Gemmataceae bacterium]|nr:plasmid stabilization system protein [Gemmataceae bacterium]